MSDQTSFLNYAAEIWAARERKCLAILERAMMALTPEQKLLKNENDLNRALYFCMLTATRELFPDDEIAPLAECNNQPDPDDIARSKREQKRPDFQWAYLDRYEPDPERSSRQFVVECKRIGKATRTDWILNSNYSEYGICRFRDPLWGYGKRAECGAMVAYWESMEPSELLDDVNSHCLSYSIPEMVLVGSWNKGGVSRLGHNLNRTFELSPFLLHHLWVDLR